LPCEVLPHNYVAPSDIQIEKCRLLVSPLSFFTIFSLGAGSDKLISYYLALFGCFYFHCFQQLRCLFLWFEGELSNQWWATSHMCRTRPDFYYLTADDSHSANIIQRRWSCRSYQ